MTFRITFALSSFYPEHRAGTETYVLNLSKELIKLAYKVSIIVPAVGKESYNYEYEGIPVYAFLVPKKISTKELNGLEPPTGLEEFKILLKKIQPDILHMHSLSRSLHAEHLKVASGLGIKTVFTAHLGSTFCVKGNLLLFGNEQCNGLVQKQRCLACFTKENKGFSKSVGKLTAWLINQVIIKSPLIYKMPALHIVSNKINQLSLLQKFSDQNIAIALWLKSVFVINGIKNTSLILQGINSINNARDTAYRKSTRKINLIFVGRMHPDKGIHLIIEALQNIDKKHFNLTIIAIPFADEMDYYNQMKKQFFALEYSDWCENLKQEEVSLKLNETDILILPSTRNEAAPLVILEAFAKKVPVIGSDYIAIKEMVKHNVNGLLFKNGDADSLKEQLLRLINEPDLLNRLKQNIEPVRTFKQVAEEHDKVYKKLMY